MSVRRQELLIDDGSHRHRNRSRIILSGAGALLLAAIAMLIVAIVRPTDQWLEYQSVLNDVNNGVLVPNVDGIVSLPPNFRTLSLDGRAYLSVQPDGSVWCLFPEWRGKGANFYGKAVLLKGSPTPAPTSLRLVLPYVPMPSATHLAQRDAVTTKDVAVLASPRPGLCILHYDLD